MHVYCRLRVVPIFLRDSRASETRARVKSNHTRKTRRARRRVSPFWPGMIFNRARVSLALISLGKNGDRGVTIHIPCGSMRFLLLSFDFDYFDSIT